MKSCLLFIGVMLLPEISLSQDFCNEGLKSAQEMILKGQIVFPQGYSKSSSTMLKLLEVDYSIMHEPYWNGSCIVLENEEQCFYARMKREIDRKWGKRFLPKLYRLAKNLDQNGLGYKRSTNAIVEHRIQKELIENNFTQLDELAYWIVLMFDELGF